MNFAEKPMKPVPARGPGDHRTARRGRVLVFSGLDGSGKSTQLELLEKSLRGENVPTSTLYIRLGFTPVMKAIKSLLHRPGTRKAGDRPASSPGRDTGGSATCGVTYRLYMHISLLELIVAALVIHWLVWRGRVVLCDRYFFDSEIIFAEKCPGARMSEWWSWKILRRLELPPDTVFFLDTPLDTIVRRIEQRGDTLFEGRPAFEERLAVYRRRIPLIPGSHILDGRLGREELSRLVLDIYRKAPEPTA